MVNSSTISYFKDKADQYDLVDDQIYWVLSDKLLWYAFNEVLKTLPKDFTFLDAGGGTGRWTLKILENYPLVKGVICDLSPDMLRVAKEKLEKRGFMNRMGIICGDIENPTILTGKTFDLSFNFHNVIGFVSSPQNNDFCIN